MAFKRVELGLALVLMVMLLRGAKAQSSCSNTLMNLAPCLNYITGNSSNPSSSCCSSLTNAVQSSPQCLCSVLNGGAASLGITVNQTLALSLPGACKVNTPPLTQCKAANSPTGSTIPPATSPVADSPNETPDASTTPSASDPLGGGSKSVPSTDGSSSDGSSIKASTNFVLFLLFILSCSSTITSF